MKRLLFIFISVLICGSAAAQHKITGKVTDQLGCSLTGAIVQVEGKENLKTATDKSGEYSISVPKNTTHLVYSYPNMNKTMVEIQGRTKIDVTMTSVKHLQELFYGKKESDDKSKVLYLVDGKIVSEAEFKAIPADEIKDVNILKGISSAIVANTKSGVNVTAFMLNGNSANPVNKQITTVTVDKTKSKPIKIQTEESISIKADDDTSFGPIGTDTYKTGENTTVSVSKDMVNGKIVTISKKSDANSKVQALVVVKDAEGKTYKVNNVNSIDVSTIKSMTVLKSGPAKEKFSKYGDTAEGVIYIELKEKSAK
ncbi:MAG: carboxypeptidase-like regulatory domain-containing protein [Alistipes sp.]|nr:carboxypeptidase-like regulatory domain-containing protein [Alistipes sp.]